MPMYTYKCPECDKLKEVAMTMAEEGTVAVLCKCRGAGKSTVMQRNFQADLFSTPKDTYSKPIISDAMAVPLDQIAEHKATFPDIRMTDQGQPIFENYAKHEAYLKKTGFVKSPAKIRKRVKKLTTV